MAEQSIALLYPDKVDRKSEKSTPVNESSATMGDSYEQSAPKGLNPVRDVWKMQWVGLTKAEKDLLEPVLRSGGSWQVYAWTPCYETVEQYFRMTSQGYNVKHVGGNNIFTISCTLKQIFDIVLPPV